MSRCLTWMGRGPGLGFCCGAMVLVLWVSDAVGAGFFLAPRGVRSLARGGAYVAGAEDSLALSYNPAGIAEASGAVSVDLAMARHETRYRRTVAGDDSVYAPVRGRGLGLPSPTLAGIVAVPGMGRLRLGIGLAADYPLLQNWPVEASDGGPAAQRYAIGDFRGTRVFKTALGLAYQLGDWISVGGALQAFMGDFVTHVTVSACDGFVCAHPENADYDAAVEVRAQNLVVPGAHLGVLVKVTPWFRQGLSWESGYKIDHPASLAIRMPSAAMYDDSTLAPEDPKGKVRMRLPQTLRWGTELRWDEWLRGEFAVVWEDWSVHRRIAIDTSGVTMSNVFGLGDYSLAPMKIERQFRDVLSLRLGGEWAPLLGDERPLTLRFGAMVEPSAIPKKTLTAMSVDLDKVIAAVGAAYRWRWLKVELTYAHVFMRTTRVEESLVLQTNPTRPQWSKTTSIGEGTYRASADVFGLGVHVAL